MYNLSMINFDERLIELNTKEAKKSHIDIISIGLGYTTVILNDGRCGLCYTYLDRKEQCTVYKGESYEGRCCYDLLTTLKGCTNTVERSVIIAMINAINVYNIDTLGKDKSNLFDDLKLVKCNKIGMIGYFRPVVKEFKDKGVETIAYDIGQGVGNEKEFYDFVAKEANALIITATSFINNTFSTIMDRIEGFNKPTAVLGPSTIMEKELYEGTPVTIIGGTLPLENDEILKAIRNGKGTPELHKHSRKIYQVIK
jgi:uncharacterized protein (DUF4213/DUF364 family)